MLEPAHSRHGAPARRQLCAAICCATSDKTNTKSRVNVAWQRVLLDSDESTDECGNCTSLCDSEKFDSLPSKPHRMQLAVPLGSVSCMKKMPIRRRKKVRGLAKNAHLKDPTCDVQHIGSIPKMIIRSFKNVCFILKEIAVCKLCYASSALKLGRVRNLSKKTGSRLMKEFEVWARYSPELENA